jgi:hypothetical protein
VQVPGAGLDRIDRSQLRPGLALANAYGHEAGIADYVIGCVCRKLDSAILMVKAAKDRS